MEWYRSGHNGTDSKSVVPIWYRGFESHPLRQSLMLRLSKESLFYMEYEKESAVILNTIADSSLSEAINFNIFSLHR